MKRVLFVSVLVAALTVPSAALSSAQDYSSGAAKRGFLVNFEVVSQNGKPKQVKKFTFADVLMTCTEGDLNLSSDNQGFGPMKVENKEFGKRFPFNTAGGGEGSVKIAGEFKQHNTRVKGTLRATGDFPNSDRTGCDSGKLDWLAA